MLQLGIHCVIIDLIVSLCKDISSERKRKWPAEVGPICDREEWVAKGRPNPIGTISASMCPEYHPVQILKVLNDFFQNPGMQDRLRMSIIRRPRQISVDYDPNLHTPHEPLSSMELFNGRRVFGGGVRNDSHPHGGTAISYVNSWDGSEWVHSSLEYEHNYYKAWDCENDFVHPKNGTIGFYTEEYVNRCEWDRRTFGRIPHNMLMYSDIDFRDDNHPYFWDRDNTIRGFTKNEKKKFVHKFLEELCENYKVDGPGVSPFNRVTWYEVSEFIKFYYDSWQGIEHPEGDEEGWVAEDITTEPLSSYRYTSNMYDIPGVWNMDEGGEWSKNFERIMKLGTNHRDDWFNSIWKKKYETSF